MKDSTEVNMEHLSMKDLLDQYDSTDKVYVGDVVEGVVISSNPDEVMINLQYVADGILPKSEMPDGNPTDYRVGDKIKVFVVKLNDGQGNVLLSLTKAYEIIVWEEFQRLFELKKPFSVKVKEVVKGGVVAQFKGASVFIPASQVALHYVEDLKPYIGMTLEVVLTEYDAATKKVVASHKEILKEQEAAKKGDALSRISVGDQLTGTVVKLADYGAFVELGSVQGLIHVSQMSWKRVKHPSEVLSVGDAVKVQVLAVDRDKEKVSLKLSEIAQNPWTTLSERYQVNDIVTGTVTRIMNFGAFVEIEEGVEGLIHISELSEERVNKVTDIVKIGMEVEAVILEIDSEQQKLALSIKALSEFTEEDFELLEEQTPSNTTMSDLFGDKLKNLKF